MNMQLSKINKYVKLLSNDRQMHHRYVVEQKVLNSFVPLSEMSSKELRKFEKDLLNYLLYIDLPQQDYTKEELLCYTSKLFKIKGKRSKALDNIDSIVWQVVLGGHCYHALHSALFDYLVKSES